MIGVMIGPRPRPRPGPGTRLRLGPGTRYGPGPGPDGPGPKEKTDPVGLLGPGHRDQGLSVCVCGCAGGVSPGSYIYTSIINPC